MTNNVAAMVAFLRLVQTRCADDAVRGFDEDERRSQRYREEAEANGWIDARGKLTPAGDLAISMEPAR